MIGQKKGSTIDKMSKEIEIKNLKNELNLKAVNISIPFKAVLRATFDKKFRGHLGNDLRDDFIVVLEQRMTEYLKNER